ncbi:hypothetical protein VK70_20935 [Paenibacillus durus ATCC 35681]|uniref:HTH araC/xylS-type domain-containing protein n=1 Tax=Paenibacillus durus ATCC 35681 TaxID=1333534 RepID=A0A0F7FFN7_PAEDU|nr:hypothetical protein VK70_20935 [Paenibacillus durus ATCC 35681]
MVKIDLYDDNSECVSYNSPDLPLLSNKAKISYYPNYAATSHWHDDIEFIIMLSGYMSYNVNGEVNVLQEGDGVFINSRQLHFGYSADRSDCEFIYVLLHPILLCANQYMEQSLVTPIIANSTFPYKHLSSKITWEKEIIDSVIKIYETELGKNKSYPLTVQSLFYRIWALLFEHNPNTLKNEKRTHYKLSSLKEMVGYIQKHYSKKITLEDIANAGKVCKSSCCRIFQDYLHQTPIVYLTGYRLNKSMELLRITDMHISEIAYVTGFSGASYFTETFRKTLGYTPSEYRDNMKGSSSFSLRLLSSRPGP